MRNYNKTVMRIVGILVTIFSLIVGTSIVNAEEFSVQAGVQAEWEIKSVSVEPTAWYRIDVWTLEGNWVAENNSKIEYTVTETNDDIYGDLHIGNLTVTNTSSTEIASNMILGILSWGPGLITHTNWTKHTNEANEQAQSEWILGTIEITESPQNYMDKPFDTIKFVLTSSSQNTTMIFDKNSGFLLESQTGFLDYSLDIEISSTNPELEGANGQFIALSWDIVILPFVISVGLMKWRKRKRNQQ